MYRCPKTVHELSFSVQHSFNQTLFITSIVWSRKKYNYSVSTAIPYNIILLNFFFFFKRHDLYRTYWILFVYKYWMNYMAHKYAVVFVDFPSQFSFAFPVCTSPSFHLRHSPKRAHISAKFWLVIVHKCWLSALVFSVFYSILLFCFVLFST